MVNKPMDAEKALAKIDADCPFACDQSIGPTECPWPQHATARTLAQVAFEAGASAGMEAGLRTRRKPGGGESCAVAKPKWLPEDGDE